MIPVPLRPQIAREHADRARHLRASLAAQVAAVARESDPVMRHALVGGVEQLELAVAREDAAARRWEA